LHFYNRNSINHTPPFTAGAVIIIFSEVQLHQHHAETPHRAIGLALLLGFVFMLLVDQIGGASHSHAPDNIRLGKRKITATSSY